jgi:integrase
MLTIRDRKDPREKRGDEDDRIFPYAHKSAGTAFTRVCQDLGIEDLHLRHEGTSRLFEAGFEIQQVALVTGHKDGKMLRRYTHLRPEALHAIAHRKAAA